MRLTDHTDYLLRDMMYLNQNKKLTTLNQLSEELGISRNNLIKVSTQLAKLGFIQTVRGRVGGIWLSEGAGKTTLKDIIRNTEETLDLASCFSNKDFQCTFRQGCLLKKSLQNALNAFLNSLGQITLNDVTPKGTGNLKKGDQIWF